MAEYNQFMGDDRFQFISDAGDERKTLSVLTRIYRDIGLAAVAEALRLPAEGSEPDMVELLSGASSICFRLLARLCQPEPTRKNSFRERAPEASPTDGSRDEAPSCRWRRRRRRGAVAIRLLDGV